MKEPLALSPLFDEGCVLQAGMPVRLWGTGHPGATISVSIQNRQVEAIVNIDGTWNVTLDVLETGGPYSLTAEYMRPASENVSTDCGIPESDSADMETPVSHQVYVGEVFICAGQSNMEYQMEFLHWRYPSEFNREPDALLRHCKVPVRFDFHKPRRDFDEPVRWVGAAPDTLDEFSGIGYFFGRMVREWLDVPVGLLNITLGGSPIESWMDEETLANWPQTLADLEPYRDDDVALTRSEMSIALKTQWYENLAKAETSSDNGLCGTATLPAFLADVDSRLSEFRGVIHLRKTVTLPTYVDGCSAALHLGAMVDSDTTRVNGVVVGSSEHQYLSRDYVIPAGVLHAGRNEIDVRLVVEHGAGRVTPGKHMHIDIGDDSFNLDGAWHYEVTSIADTDCPDEDFVRWKPLGLYNGMTATCAGYGARAVLWYQGESNTGDTADAYGRMLASMIGCWRKAWGQDRLPFLVVQLPGFSIDGVEDGGWPLVRYHQWKAAQDIDDVAVVVTLDVGDWNDLHPWNKRAVADRLFYAAQRLAFGYADSPRSPEPVDVQLAAGKLTVSFDDGTGDCGLGTIDGTDPGEFELVWEDGSSAVVQGRVAGNSVTIDVPWRRPASVKYAWRNAPERGLLCGVNGMPVGPFVAALM